MSLFLILVGYCINHIIISHQAQKPSPRLPLYEDLVMLAYFSAHSMDLLCDHMKRTTQFVCPLIIECHHSIYIGTVSS